MKNSKDNTSVVKPCPFCGGYPLIYNASGVYIECAECGMSTRQKETQREAVEFWNTRVFGGDIEATNAESGADSKENGASGDE